MPKDEYFQRIEGVFGNIGLGNTDPEKLVEFVEAYEHAMDQADLVKRLKNRKGKTFQSVLESIKDEKKEEES